VTDKNNDSIAKRELQWTLKNNK